MRSASFLTRTLVALRLKSPALSLADAEKVAQRECLARGFGWDPPIRIGTGFLWYVVETNTDCAGGNATVVIDRATGKVVHAGMVSR